MCWTGRNGCFRQRRPAPGGRVGPTRTPRRDLRPCSGAPPAGVLSGYAREEAVMSTINRNDRVTAGVEGRSPARVSTERVWGEIANASFAVLSYVTPAGEPRSSG